MSEKNFVPLDEVDKEAARLLTPGVTYLVSTKTFADVAAEMDEQHDSAASSPASYEQRPGYAGVGHVRSGNTSVPPGQSASGSSAASATSQGASTHTPGMSSTGGAGSPGTGPTQGDAAQSRDNNSCAASWGRSPRY